MAAASRLGTLILLLLPPMAAAAGDGQAGFAFNIFTDLAPLLALFGEQFARQFMSESLTWLDHIIFAMAPLGIITAIVSAIRVAGPPWARAFIGRARESRAAAEIELMSSTSREVCEVFNGKGVVRAMGTPKLTQLLYFPGSNPDSDTTCGLHTLETAYDSDLQLLQQGRFGIRRKWDSNSGRGEPNQKENGGKSKTGEKTDAYDRGGSDSKELGHERREGGIKPIVGINSHLTRRRTSWGRQKLKEPDLENVYSPNSPPTARTVTTARMDRNISEAPEREGQQTENEEDNPFPPELKGSAPNLQLNLPTTVANHNKPIKELIVAASTAMTIQVAIIVVSAITTFHTSTRKAVGDPQSKYGFHLFVSGTLFLNTGMIFCSWVIEQSTREHIWRKKTAAKKTYDRATASELDFDKAATSGVTSDDKVTSLQEASPKAIDQEQRFSVTELKSRRRTSSLPKRTITSTDTFEKNDRAEVYLFWLQQKHTVNDQDFDPYLVLGGRKEEILTSSRIDHPKWDKFGPVHLPKWMMGFASNKYELATIFAALIGLAGFILQFEGLRGLAYPTAVTQLLATFVMTLIRATVRRRLGIPPYTVPASEDHVLDWLALRLVYDQGLFSGLEPEADNSVTSHRNSTTWNILTKPDKRNRRLLVRKGIWIPTAQKPPQPGKDMKSETNSVPEIMPEPAFQPVLRSRFGPLSNPSAEKKRESGRMAKGPTCKRMPKPTGRPFPSESQAVVKFRQRLGQLTRCPGSASNEAIALSQAISLVLNELCLDDGSQEAFEWSYETMTKSRLCVAQSHKDNIEQSQETLGRITLRAKKEDSAWVVHSPDIDAILSLWMASFADSATTAGDKHGDASKDWLIKKASVAVKYRRILGENPAPKSTSKRAPNPESDPSSDPAPKTSAQPEPEIGQASHSAPNTTVHEATTVQGRTEILTWALNWWMNDPRLAGIENSDGCQSAEMLSASIDAKTTSSGGEELVIGFNGVREDPDDDKEELSYNGRQPISIVSSSPLANILAHHVFSGFMWAISEFIPSDSFHQVTVEGPERFLVSDSKLPWSTPTLRDRGMMKLVRRIESFGLGPSEDVLLDIIPPLSYRGILPNRAMLDLLLKKAHDSETLHEWDQAAKIYGDILDLHIGPRHDDRISYEVTVELIEFLFIAKETLEDRKDPVNATKSSMPMQARLLARAVSIILAKLQEHKLLFEVVEQLRWFYEKQRRHRIFNALFPGLWIKVPTETSKPTQPNKFAKPTYAQNPAGVTAPTMFSGHLSSRPQDPVTSSKDEPVLPPEQSLMDLVNFSPYHRYTCSIPSVLESEDTKFATTPDIFGWTPLHYAVVGDSEDIFKHVLSTFEYNICHHHELHDKSGRTPLHYAAMHCEDRVKRLTTHPEVSKSAAAMKARDGALPIHCAARSGHLKAVRILDAFLPISLATDAFRRSPIHLAAIGGYRNIVDFCIKKHDAIEQCSEELSMRNALHLALLHGRKEVAMELIVHEQAVTLMCAPDTENKTPVNILLDNSNNMFLGDLLIKYASTVQPRADGSAETQPRLQLPSHARASLLLIVEHAVQSRKTQTLKFLFHHVMENCWEEKLILEAFRIASQEENLEMLLPLLRVLDRIQPKIDTESLLTDTLTIREADNRVEVGDEYDIQHPDNSGDYPMGNDEFNATNPTLSDEVREYLRSNFNGRRQTLITWAIHNGKDDFIQELMQEGVMKKQTSNISWNKKDDGNRSPLAWLAKVKPSNILPVSKREKMLEFLWSSWTDDEKRSALNELQGRYDKTPLIYAVKNGLEVLVKRFCQAGAKIQGEDAHRESAFSYALDIDNKRIRKLLVDHDPQVVNEKKRKWGITPLIDALYDGREDVISFLSTCTETDPNLGDKDGDTPLMWTTLENGHSSAELLLKWFPKIDPLVRNSEGRSPLISAYTDSINGNNESMFSRLLSLPSTDRHSYEITLLLSHAISRKKVEHVKLLLKSGADPRSHDDAGRSMIFLATLYGDRELFDLLRQYLDVSDHDQLELVWHACALSFHGVTAGIVDRLVEEHIASNTLDRNDWTALQCAHWTGNMAMEEVLKRHASHGYNIDTSLASPTNWAICPDNPFVRVSWTSEEHDQAELELVAPSSPGLTDLVHHWEWEQGFLIRANHCIPFNQPSFYFEIKILQAPVVNILAIGICSESTSPHTFPGWPNSASYGYHSDDGHLYRLGEGAGEPLGDAYDDDDTVGCCVKMEERIMFFTKNGYKMGSDISFGDDLKGPLYPCATILTGPSSVGTRIRANFGNNSKDSFMWREHGNDLSSTEEGKGLAITEPSVLQGRQVSADDFIITDGDGNRSGRVIAGLTEVEDSSVHEASRELSIPKGIEVNENGIINGSDGNAVGRLVEG